MPDLVGHTLGQYRVVEQIGLGGMATVFKAYQPALDRYVAIKVLPAYYAHEPGFAERFTREAKAVARLTHPHVLPIYDFGQENDLSYIVMQYVDAGTLKDILGRPISLTTATDIIEQIAEALDYAHERGIIHRDVKPSNVLMDRGRWVLLSDFGLAKMVEGSIQLTGSGVGVGTPAYMAPEQGQGLKVDRRVDIYSLGIILYEMVTGRVPFEAETPMAIVVKHITEPLPLPRRINPDVPEAVERVIMKALAKNPDDRYEAAGKMAAALRKVVAGLDTAVAEAVPLPPGVAAEPVAAPTVLEEGGATQVVPPPVMVPAPAETPKSKPVWKRLPTWAIVAGGALLLVLLLIGCFGLARRIRTGQVARATQTAAAQAAVSTPTAAGGTVATPTPAPPPAERPTATPTAPPPTKTPPPPPPDTLGERVMAFVKENPPVFKDDFSIAASGWKVADDEHGLLDYQDSSYVMQVPLQGEKNKLGVQLPFDAPLADFALQVDVTLIKGGRGADWAITFRAPEPDRGLYARLSTQPRGYGIGRLSPEGEVPLVREMLPGYRPAQTTQVMLVAIGPDVTLLLDGQRVGVARTDLMQPGRLGFTVVNTGDPLVAYRLDNVRLWDLGPLAGQPPEQPPRQPSGQELPVSENFENADRWDGPGWKVVQDETGNSVLQGEKHSFVAYRGGNWQDIHLRFKMKRLDGDSLHVNFRLVGSASGLTRYMVHLMPETIVLHKFIDDREQKLPGTVAQVAIPRLVWHTVDITARGGHIEVSVDDRPVLMYDDPEPLGPGTVAFENGDPPARHQIDDVLIEPAGP